MELLEKGQALLSRLEEIKSLNETEIDFIREQLNTIENEDLLNLDEEFDEWRALLYEQGEPNAENEGIINQIDDIIMKAYDFINSIHEQFGLEESFDDEDEHKSDEDQYEIVLREVSKIALKTIGIDCDDQVFVDIMSTILIEINIGNNDDIIVGKVLAQLVISGLGMPIDQIHDMCKKTREKCSRHLFGLKIAINSLIEYNCSAEDALSQIAPLLEK